MFLYLRFRLVSSTKIWYYRGVKRVTYARNQYDEIGYTLVLQYLAGKKYLKN